MTQAVMPTLIAGGRELGVIGSRQLHAVQVIDIGRLTAHVAAFVPSTFVAISGRGPKGDSNESGKTTFLAATALLLGDPEWKLAAGGQHAHGLLFDPALVGAVDGIADRAEHGYVIGVFARPGEPPSEPMTVWMRVNRQSPYIEVKVQDGMAFVNADGPRPAGLAADEHWNQMPHLGGGRAYGARAFVEALYGATPRCIAHLTKRADLRGGRSLLNTAAGSFEPEEIGAALISLAGRQDMLDVDREQRVELQRSEQQLGERQAAFAQREREYEQILADVDARDRARSMLRAASEDWRTHDARRYLDALDEHTSATQRHDALVAGRPTLAEAERAAAERLDELGDDTELRRRHEQATAELGDADEELEEANRRWIAADHAMSTARDRERDLAATADGWTGPGPVETLGLLAAAQDATRAAEIAVGVARADVDRADTALTDARDGRGDAKDALAALSAARIDAHGLLDAIELDEHARSRLEGLLWPYRDAVVVDPADHDRALTALAEQPWAVIASGDPAIPAPDGVRGCPPAACQLLTALTQRGTAAIDPARAIDAELSVTVIGGVDPLTGRQARIQAAEQRARDAAATHATAKLQAERLTLIEQARRDDHTRATAWARLAEAQAAAAGAAQAVETRAGERERARQARSVAEAAARELAVTVASLDAARARAEEKLDEANRALTAQDEATGALQVSLMALRDAVDSAEAAWADGEAAARERCAADSRDEGRLRNSANDTLGDALRELGMRRDEDWAPTDELLHAWRRRREDVNTPFPLLAGPLSEYLDEREPGDETQRERIEADRARMTDALGAAEIEVTQTRAALERIQNAIQTSIEAAIAGIEEQFDRLDHEAGGHGAQLELHMRQPADASDTWHWLITPMWRRTPGGRMVPYSAPTNSAQDKLYTVNLVLAALLAVPNPESRVLILDELGDSLGFEHRRDVLRAIAETAHDRGITVLGTCQDDVLHHAADFTQEIVFFEYADDTHVLNRPVRLFGYDPNRQRVELTKDALLRGRPAV